MAACFTVPLRLPKEKTEQKRHEYQLRVEAGFEGPVYYLRDFLAFMITSAVTAELYGLIN